MNRKFLIFILFYLIIPNIFGGYISQINFLNDEFVEIYSNSSLNLINSTIQDENNGFNNLIKIKNSTSKYSLIIGSNFLNKNNLSKLNCSIYYTKSSGPGKSGLKNSGENIRINLSNILNYSNISSFSNLNSLNNSHSLNSLNKSNFLSLIFIKTKNYLFKKNQSLFYNFSNKSYYIQKKSPCKRNNPNFEGVILNSGISNLTLLNNNSLNLTNFNSTSFSNITKNKLNNTKLNNIKLNKTKINISKKNIDLNLTDLSKIKNCSYVFKINSKKNITLNQIKFDFTFNNSININSKYNITYWIENYEGKILKKKLITFNKNIKYYTPKDFTNIYFLKAIFRENNCVYKDSKMIIYYSKENSYFKNYFNDKIIKKNQNKNENKNINKNRNTLNNNFNINKNLELKVLKKLKFSNFSKIKILNSKFIINSSNNFTSKIEYFIYKGNTSKRAIYFYINNNKKFSFQLKKYQNKSGILYFNKSYGKNNISIFGLNLKEELIFNYSNLNNYSSFRNLSKFKNLSKINRINVINLINNSKNLNLINNSGLNLNLKNKINLFSDNNEKILKKNSEKFVSKFSKNELFSSINLKSFEKSKNKSVYISKNIDLKEKSFYFSFIGVSMILSSLIFLW